MKNIIYENFQGNSSNGILYISVGNGTVFRFVFRFFSFVKRKKNFRWGFRFLFDIFFLKSRGIIQGFCFFRNTVGNSRIIFFRNPGEKSGDFIFSEIPGKIRELFLFEIPGENSKFLFFSKYREKFDNQRFLFFSKSRGRIRELFFFTKY